MKNRIPIYIASLLLTFVFGMSLMAQEKTEVSVQVKKDGKVLKDTVYQFEDEAEAKNAIQMMEVLSGEEIHMEHSKAMVFISEDGEKTEIKHMDGDSLVWISEDEHPHGEHVVIVKSGDGETFDILIDEDEDGKKVVKKEVKVIVSDGEEGSWTVDGDDVHVEIEEIIKEHGEEGENVKVIVIKKNGDHDHDHDEDHDVDVEVKVIKKEKK